MKQYIFSLVFMAHIVSEEKGTLARELLHQVPQSIQSICDMGTGKTSLSLLLEIFPHIRTCAVTHPQDDRKITSVQESVGGSNFDLMLADLATWEPQTPFDLVFAHQFLGEVTMHNQETTFEAMVNQIFAKSSQYVIIFDYVEDPSIDWEYVHTKTQSWGNILADLTYERSEPFAGTAFTGKTYRGILTEKK